MDKKQSHIHVLPDNVINKIAAGEVVERPASVVKELLENSLDAGATDIGVEIVAGGRTLISVSDNGAGMDRNDALLSVERHATSKISSVDDIEGVATLGFRGEALAAISAVSRFTLRTRPAEALAGTELTMAGGKMQEVRDAGCPPGTCVEVRQLFFNVPARRKFMRSEQTESAHIRRVVMTYALANPKVGLKLKADGRVIYNLPANASIEDRVGDLFVSVPKRDLRKVERLFGDLRLAGYVALPSLTRADRSEQYLFINKRPASAALLSSAIREAYHTLIPRDRHPIIFLFLDIDPALVDVNVHPSKKEVRFRNPGDVRNAVAEAVRKAITNPGFAAAGPDHAIPTEFSDQEKVGRGVPLADPSSRLPGRRSLADPCGRHGQAGTGGQAAAPSDVLPSGRDKIHLPPRLFDYSLARKQRPSAPLTQPATSLIPEPAAEKESASAAEEGRGRPWAWRRVVGQIGSLYIIMETEDGLVLMDPHAAHERILFEKYMAGLTKGAVESQALLMAESIVLSPADAMGIRRAFAELKKAGFGFAEFGQDTFLVDALPACFGNVSAQQLLAEIAAELSESSGRSGSGSQLEELIAQAACHAAVKAHSNLSSGEIEHLITQLEEAEMPYTCPHGRPIIIHFSFKELAKKFGRSAPRGGN